METRGTAARGTHRHLGIRTSNNAEAFVCGALEDKGWEVIKRGWPDFLAIRDGKVRLIEVKPNCISTMSPAQKRVAEILETLGLEVELLHPEDVA